MSQKRTFRMLLEPQCRVHWLNHHLPAPLVSGDRFFGHFLQRLSRIKRPQNLWRKKEKKVHTNDNNSENEKNQIKSRGASTNPLLSSIYWVAFCNIFAKASFGFTWPKSADREYFLKANIFAIFLQRRFLVSLDPNPLIRDIFSRHTETYFWKRMFGSFITVQLI